MNTRYDGLEVAKRVCSRLHGEKGLSFLANHPKTSPIEAVRIHLSQNDRGAAYRTLAKGMDQDLILKEIFGPEFEPFFDEHMQAYITSIGYTNDEARKCFTERPRLWEVMIRLIPLWNAFDVFIPIPQGGLFLGALTAFFGYPTYPLEIHAHKRIRAESLVAWKKQPLSLALENRKVLVLEDDMVGGNTVRRAIEEIQAIARPRKIAITVSTSPFFSGSHHTGDDFGQPREVIEDLSRQGYRTHFLAKLKPSHVEALYERYRSRQLNL